MFSTLVSTAQLAQHLDDPNWVIVDVRHDLAQPDAWGRSQYRDGHIPGARFAHVDGDLSAEKTGRNGRHPLPTPEQAAATFGRLGIDRSKQVVAYDQGNGMYAARLWWMLRWLGHDAVAVLDGGYARWTAEKRPVTTDEPSVAPTTLDVERVAPTVSASGVAASLPRHTLVLVDARGAERYRGDTEPMDPVAGHIPGAINRPFTRNLKPDATFRPASELRREFDSMLHGRSVDDVVHYCGSGVSACHNVLAMAVAGYPLARLYPGSWSEWVSDRSRPVATGGA
ncbi:MAG TPA: sulfurtransferase [Casimicrobiaceae bacterium]